MKLKKKITIINPQGLHARPAAVFVKIANKFKSDILVKKGHEKVSGKSIMGLMTLAANKGSALELEIDGPDAEAAMNELETFLTNDSESPAGGGAHETA